MRSRRLVKTLLVSLTLVPSCFVWVPMVFLMSPQLEASQPASYETKDGVLVSRATALSRLSAPLGTSSCAACQATEGEPAVFDGVLELVNGRRISLQSVPIRSSVYALSDAQETALPRVLGDVEVLDYCSASTIFSYDPATKILLLAALKSGRLEGLILGVEVVSGDTFDLQGGTIKGFSLSPQVVQMVRQIAESQDPMTAAHEVATRTPTESTPQAPPKTATINFVTKPTAQDDTFAIPFESIPSLETLDACVSAPGYSTRRVPGLADSWVRLSAIHGTSIEAQGYSETRELRHVRDILLVQFWHSDPEYAAMVKLPYAIKDVLAHLEPGDEVMLEWAGKKVVKLYLRCDAR